MRILKSLYNKIGILSKSQEKEEQTYISTEGMNLNFKKKKNHRIFDKNNSTGVRHVPDLGGYNNPIPCYECYVCNSNGPNLCESCDTILEGQTSRSYDLIPCSFEMFKDNVVWDERGTPKTYDEYLSMYDNKYKWIPIE